MSSQSKKPRLRFAPSPTGYVHFGGLRTFLFDYLYVKKHDGTLIIRIEDTDAGRYVEGATAALLAVFRSVGLMHDEGVFLDEQDNVVQKGDVGPYIQSERRVTYAEHAKKLLDADIAYYCFCTSARLQELRERQQHAKQPPRYDGHCRTIRREDAEKRLGTGERAVVRLRVPEGATTYHDVLRGAITVDNATIDDQVLMKSDGFPTYHLASVVDDHLMRITHVTRAEEWLPSTPKHQILYNAFGWDPPTFVHFSMLLNEHRQKLSKRQADVSVADIMKKGYLPEAIINFAVMLGWHPKGDEEILSLEQIIEQFDFDRLQKAGAIFSEKKLQWINGQHIRSMAPRALLPAVVPFLPLQRLTETSYKTAFGDEVDDAYLEKVVAAIQDRLVTLQDAYELSSLFFAKDADYPADLLMFKKTEAAQTKEHLAWIETELEKLTNADFTVEILKEHFFNAIGACNLVRGDMLWPFRVALSGSKQSPDVFAIAAAFGKHKTIDRVHTAWEKIK